MNEIVIHLEDKTHTYIYCCPCDLPLEILIKEYTKKKKIPYNSVRLSFGGKTLSDSQTLNTLDTDIRNTNTLVVYKKADD